MPIWEGLGANNSGEIQALNSKILPLNKNKLKPFDIMRLLIILVLLILNTNSYSQDSFENKLVVLDSSMPFRLKKVELYANKMLGSEDSREQYFMFEFPSDTSTLLVFTNRIKKKAVKRGIQLVPISLSTLGDDIIIKYKNEYYQVRSEPNFIVGRSLFFTNKGNIYLNGEFYEITDRLKGEIICELYGYKYNFPVPDRYKVLFKRVTLLSEKGNVYEVKYEFQSLISSIGWSHTIYQFEMNKGLQTQMKEESYSMTVKKIIKP